MARKARWPGGGFPMHATAWGRKTFENDSGDHSQPDPLAGLGDTQSTQASTGRIQGTVVNLIRNPGRSRDTKSIRAANPGRSRDTKSIRAANPSTHGPSVPETREANVKCTDKTEGKLDVRRHLHN
ncbi:hypothetical protein L3X38_003160 [Prunus dulcis]|uniref:Uncharacterized protein n=1 Tax=Prunus dulcis TaxID=3755 RepID=A0AAD5F1K0_PRUDU|nr:hypothetical protein L3X38_003160 [Prunus dulcis]